MTFKKEYYYLNSLLSYNRTLSMVVGERSVGKTYASKVHCIKRFKKHGEQFVYLRRFKKSDLKNIAEFFDDIRDEFPKDKLMVKGSKFYINGKLMGYALALSEAQSIKSTPYPLVQTLMFDEFILEKTSRTANYLPNEVSLLLSIAYTIFRDRKNTRMILLANSGSTVNPYFIDFNIQLKRRDNQRFTFSNDLKYRDYVIVENVDVEKVEDENLSPLQQLISRSDYGGLAMDNEFSEDNNSFISKRSKKSEFNCGIKIDGQVVGVWCDYDNAVMYITEKVDGSHSKYFALDSKSIDEKYIPIKDYRNNYDLKLVVSAFKNNQVFYENQFIKDRMYRIYKKLRIY